MNLKTILLIFRKEILDILRDRKALFFMILLPMLAMPLLMVGILRLGTSQAVKTRSMRLTVQTTVAEKERFVGLLRDQLQQLDGAFQLFLARAEPEMAELVRTVTGDLGISVMELLVGLGLDNGMLRHERLEELKQQLPDGLMDMRRALRNQEDSTETNGQNAAESMTAEQSDMLMELLDLATPLTSLEFLTAAEVQAIATDKQPSPTDDLVPWVQESPAAIDAARSITSRRAHAYLIVPESLGMSLSDSEDSAELTILYDSTIPLSEEAERRLRAASNRLEQRILHQRLDSHDLARSFTNPISIRSTNVAPPKKQALQIVASFLPYMIILMCFFGGFYPAIDLGAGEKERNTLESLLVTPASRLEIASGKFAVVFVASVVASVCATASLAATFQSNLAPPEFRSNINIHIDTQTAALCLLLIVPTAATFASVLLAMSIYAKTFKEAQAFMAPVQFLVIVPAVISFIPDIELNYRLAWVPILNVALGLREILGGGGVLPPIGQIITIFGSSLLVATIAVLFCARWFSQEKVLFR